MHCIAIKTICHSLVLCYGVLKKCEFIFYVNFNFLGAFGLICILFVVDG